MPWTEGHPVRDKIARSRTPHPDGPRTPVTTEATLLAMDRLNAGEALHVNDSLTSPSGEYLLTLQPDGNLVLYQQEHQPVWATGTDGQDVSTASMQEDGNLVLYSSSGDAVWATETDGNAGASVVLQDDCNLVIYSSDNMPLWATNTSI